MSGAATIEQPYALKHPISVTFQAQGGPERTETISEVTLRRATGKDMRLVDQYGHQPMEMILRSIAALSGLEYHLVERMDAEDIRPLGELAMARLEGGQPTGEAR